VQGPSGDALIFNSIALNAPQLQAAFGYPNGSVAFVNSVQDLFTFDASSTLTPDQITIVQPLAGGGRWLRRNVPSQDWAKQSTWFLDPAGDDEFSGATALLPIKTFAELARRINKLSITQATTITLAAGTYDDLRLELTIPQGIFITIQGHVTTTYTGTVQSHVATVPSTNTRGQITDPGASYTDKQRLKLASGAIAYVTRVIAPTNANVSRWGLDNPAVSITPTIVEPNDGDSYTMDTLDSIIGQTDLIIHGGGVFLTREVTINAGSPSRAHRAHVDNGTASNVRWYSCLWNAPTNNFYDYEGTIICSALAGTAVNFDGQGVIVLLRNSVIQSSVWSALNCFLDFFSSCCIDGASSVAANNTGTGNGANIRQPGTGGTPSDLQMVDISDAAAWEIFGGATVEFFTAQTVWGTNNTLTTATFIVRSGSNLLYTVKPIVAGGASDTQIGGNLKSYAQVPFYDTSHGCGFIDDV
jgi:hypothetical protein